MEDDLRLAFFSPCPSGECLHVQPCCWGVKITQALYRSDTFLSKTLRLYAQPAEPFHSSDCLSIFSAALLVFSLWDLLLLPCVLVFFLVLAFLWQVDPCLLLMKLCLSLLLFKHIFVVKFFSLGLLGMA